MARVHTIALKNKDRLSNELKSNGRYKNYFTVPASNMEPIVRNEPMAKKKMQGSNPPVNIHVHSRRHRLCDADGISAKAVIDAIVKSGILEDDSAQYVKAVTYSQEKIKKTTPESTIVTISEANNV